MDKVQKLSNSESMKLNYYSFEKQMRMTVLQASDVFKIDLS
jgi:hypothetical protein